MSDHMPTGQYQFFATCPRNTEGLLYDELRALGSTGVAETRAGVSFSGPMWSAYRACLWSRVADRILLRLKSFPVSDLTAGLDGVYEAVHAMPWEDHLDAAGTLAVEATSTIRQGLLARLNTHFAEQRVKDAVVDRFRAKTGTRPGVDLVRPDIRINLHLTPAEGVVSLDLSGDGLHRRGYRIAGGEAPLKENLAAAILLRAGWSQTAATGGALIDPMCGSGTFLIEGATMAGDVAPGLTRDYYGFLRWKGFDSNSWRELVREAGERRESGLRRLPTLIGYDFDRRAIGSARANVRRAGFASRIMLENRDLATLTVPKSAQPGLLVTNPPYGKRLGETTQLVDLYETLGERLRESFSGWEAAVFTGNPDLSAYLGLRAHRLNVLYNGPLECRLLLFHIGRPRSGGASRAARPMKQDGTEGDDGSTTRPSGATMFGNRLRKNMRHLRRWTVREDIHCYRLYDGDLPEYAVAIDLYEDWAHVQEYAAPASVDPVRARRRLKEVMATVPQVLEVPAEQVVLKVRRPQLGTDQYQRQGWEGRMMEVREGGLRFLVNLTDYLDTGLFLDHRLVRRLIRDLATGRRFLNLFAYTGSATVYAAAGGAVSTTSVDLSSTYLDWAQRNLALNGLSGPKHQFVRADCREWLTRAATQVGSCGTPVYDLVLLDAPTFSNSKSMSGTLDIQRDHADLIRDAVRILAPEGVLIFSTNCRRFKLDAAINRRFAATDISKQTIPPDFARNPRIHACYRILPTRADTEIGYFDADGSLESGLPPTTEPPGPQLSGGHDAG